MIDFILAMIRALSQQYPMKPQKGCLFDLSKNDYSKAEELDLAQLK